MLIFTSKVIRKQPERDNNPNVFNNRHAPFYLTFTPSYFNI